MKSVKIRIIFIGEMISDFKFEILRNIYWNPHLFFNDFLFVVHGHNSAIHSFNYLHFNDADMFQKSKLDFQKRFDTGIMELCSFLHFWLPVSYKDNFYPKHVLKKSCFYESHKTFSNHLEYWDVFRTLPNIYDGAPCKTH